MIASVKFPAVAWPARHDIFGVPITATHYDELIDTIIAAARNDQPGLVDFMPVHGLVTAARDPKFRDRMNAFSAVCPDGQPVRWALKWFHKIVLRDRVYGPELTWRLCQAAAVKGVPIYLYGGHPDVLARLSEKLKAAFPALIIAGQESPPFRPLTPGEDAAAVARINASGAKIVLLGIGCPRQENFAYEHKDSIHAVQLCVGAAFDFHAGSKKMAPAWMQQRGLEWLFRLTQEPGRLWKRYLVTNTLFLCLAARHAVLGR